jgi:hypothetical protein
MLISVLAINMALAFYMGNDVQALLDSNVGQPMAQNILPELSVRRGTLAVWSMLLSLCSQSSQCQSSTNVTDEAKFSV